MLCFRSADEAKVGHVVTDVLRLQPPVPVPNLKPHTGLTAAEITQIWLRQSSETDGAGEHTLFFYSKVTFNQVSAIQHSQQTTP